MFIDRFRDWFLKFSRNFIHDGLPVALAGVLGTLFVSQYNRPSSPPSVIVQPPPPPSLPLTQLLGLNISAPTNAMPESQSQRGRVQEIAPAKGHHVAAAMEQTSTKSRTILTEKNQERRATKLKPKKSGDTEQPMQLLPTPDRAKTEPSEMDGVPAQSSASEHRHIGLWHGLIDRMLEDIPRPPLPIPVVQFQFGSSM